MCLLARHAGPAWWRFVWRERVPQGTGNISKKKKLVTGSKQVVGEVNTSIADIFISNFPSLHGRVRSSKLCKIVEASLGKQQVTPEVQYPPLAGHLLQILQISYHSMKMRCEWLNMACWYSFTSQLASITFSFAVLLQVKFKIALCHSALCEHREALQEVTCFFIYLCPIFLFNIILFYENRWCNIHAFCRWKVFLRKWEHSKWIWC